MNGWSVKQRDFPKDQSALRDKGFDNGGGDARSEAWDWLQGGK